MSSVFVTVGSTLFDALIKEVTNDTTLRILHAMGYRRLVVQIGKGTIVPEEGKREGIKVEMFRYKPSLENDFLQADLVISHGGAGSCIEALEAGKPLIVVINDSLMDNHQVELAEALSDLGFCNWCHPHSLHTTLQSFSKDSLKAYVPGQPQKLVDYLDSEFKLKDV